jgi:hypothetical protein
LVVEPIPFHLDAVWLRGLVRACVALIVLAKALGAS